MECLNFFALVHTASWGYKTKTPLADFVQGPGDNMEQYSTQIMSGWRDSNPRPLRPERSTLPTEPHPEIPLFCALGQT